MFECPICDFEIHKETADWCPQCGTKFCVHCRQTSAAGPGHRFCDNTRCRYFGKMICRDCLVIAPLNLRVLLPAALLGIIVAALYVWRVLDDFSFSKALVATAIVVLGVLIARLLAGAAENCPECKAGVGVGHSA